MCYRILTCGDWAHVDINYMKFGKLSSFKNWIHYISNHVTIGFKFSGLTCLIKYSILKTEINIYQHRSISITENVLPEWKLVISWFHYNFQKIKLNINGRFLSSLTMFLFCPFLSLPYSFSYSFQISLSLSIPVTPCVLVALSPCVEWND